MNDTNLNLAEILKDCEGINLYSTIFGNCTLREIIKPKSYLEEGPFYRIKLNVFSKSNDWDISSVDEKGVYNQNYNGECTLFPSFEQRDWSKFEKPIKVNTPMMCSYNIKPFNFKVRYYSHKNNKDNKHYCFINGKKENDSIIPYDIIIPYDMFDPKDIKKSLNFNLQKI